MTLQQFVERELLYGLRVAVEAVALDDIAGTVGIQTQAYSTSVLATLRKSLTKLETSGYTPSALVLTPADWEAVELALSSTTPVVECEPGPVEAAVAAEVASVAGAADRPALAAIALALARACSTTSLRFRSIRRRLGVWSSCWRSCANSNPVLPVVAGWPRCGKLRTGLNSQIFGNPKIYGNAVSLYSRAVEFADSCEL